MQLQVKARNHLLGQLKLLAGSDATTSGFLLTNQYFLRPDDNTPTFNFEMNIACLQHCQYFR